MGEKRPVVWEVGTRKEILRMRLRPETLANMEEMVVVSVDRMRSGRQRVMVQTDNRKEAAALLREAADGIDPKQCWWKRLFR